MRTIGLLFLSLLVCVGHCMAEPRVDVQILDKGMGPEIEKGQGAVVAYRLELKDGTLIEQAGIKNPFRFTLGSTNIIPGLNQGVEGMKVGEKRLLTIPPELGYGRKNLGSIPPNSDLVFEVELLETSEETALEEEAPLSEQFQDSEVLARRHASTIEKPAMFEYLIRDFFTKPWRYSDGHLAIWRSTAKVSLVLFFSCGLALFGRKRGWWLL